jgi:hypothetical protein
MRIRLDLFVNVNTLGFGRGFGQHFDRRNGRANRFGNAVAAWSDKMGEARLLEFWDFRSFNNC